MSQFVHMMVVAPQIYILFFKVQHGFKCMCERGLQMLQVGHF